MERSPCLSYLDRWLPRSQRVLRAREPADEDPLGAVPGHRTARPRRLRKQVCHPVFTSTSLVGKSWISREQNVEREETAFISSHVVSQICTTADCRVLALFSLPYFLVSSLPQESLLLFSVSTSTDDLPPSRLSLSSISHLPFSSGCPTCPSPWPRCGSRPCGCRWTSHSLSWLFRRMWIRRRARRCSPVCCCLNSPMTAPMTTTVMFKRQICRLKCALRWESSEGDISPFLIPFRCNVPWFLTTPSHDLLEKAHSVPRPPWSFFLQDLSITRACKRWRSLRGIRSVPWGSPWLCFAEMLWIGAAKEA